MYSTENVQYNKINILAVKLSLLLTLNNSLEVALMYLLTLNMLLFGEHHLTRSIPEVQLRIKNSPLNYATTKLVFTRQFKLISEVARIHLNWIRWYIFNNKATLPQKTSNIEGTHEMLKTYTVTAYKRKISPTITDNF